MMDRTSVERVLTEATEAVQAAQISEGLRPIAFEKAIDLLSGSAWAAVAGDPGAAGEASDNGGSVNVDTANAEGFVRSQPNVERPAEAAKAIAAWWFSQYGSAPITRANVETIAQEIGVTIPDRPDATLRGMRHEGREVFRVARRGLLVPTRPHGELFFQTHYSVTKGRKPAPGADETS